MFKTENWPAWKVLLASVAGTCAFGVFHGALLAAGMYLSKTLGVWPSVVFICAVFGIVAGFVILAVRRHS